MASSRATSKWSPGAPRRTGPTSWWVGRSAPITGDRCWLREGVASETATRRPGAPRLPDGVAYGPELARSGSELAPIVGRFPRDRHVVDVALAHAGLGDPQERAAALHGGDRGVAGVAHGRAQAADQLVDDLRDRSA